MSFFTSLYSVLCIGIISTKIVMGVENIPHYFDVQKGYIVYEILGGAQLTGETNLNIQGSSKLYFDAWGTLLQEEDEGLVVTRGAINFIENVHRLEKHTKDTIITVDYENEQLLERPKNRYISSQEKETKGLLHRGQDVVAGVLCSVWIGPSVQKCIYKGVVLKQESHVLGVSYMKKAVKVNFDKDMRYSANPLPPYPLQKFSLFKDNRKTDKKTEIKNICKVFKDVVHEVDASDKSFEPEKRINRKKREKFINKIAEGIFKKQKKILPQLLFAMKKSRECLQLAEDMFERDNCINRYHEQKNALGIEEHDYILFSNTADKERLLDDVEDAIIDLEPRMACVKRAKNFIDLSACMK